jgi:hypothetical protein
MGLNILKTTANIFPDTLFLLRGDSQRVINTIKGE